MLSYYGMKNKRNEKKVIKGELKVLNERLLIQNAKRIKKMLKNKASYIYYDANEVINDFKKALIDNYGKDFLKNSSYAHIVKEYLEIVPNSIVDVGNALKKMYEDDVYTLSHFWGKDDKYHFLLELV